MIGDMVIKLDNLRILFNKILMKLYVLGTIGVLLHLFS